MTTYSVEYGPILACLDGGNQVGSPTPAPTVKRRYISPEAAAEYLGISTRTVRRLISSGELRAYRVRGGDRLVRVDLNDLDAVLDPIPNGRGA